MLVDIRSRRITGLIFSKLARLARNTRELLDFADIFRAADADLISLQESIDTSTPAGRLFYTMIAAMAQWEREEIADRVAASVVVRAKLGKPLNGKVAFGYRWKDKKVVVNPHEAPVRRLIYELFLQCRRKKAVARMLNDRGHRTRQGKLFTDTMIEHLIRDPTAKGMHRANYTQRHRDGKTRVVKPADQWVWTEVEPIVPVELWDECNHYLDDRKTRLYKRPGKRPVHLFAGYARCHCGKKMYVMSNSYKYVCQACRNRIAVTDLEAIYYEQLKGFFCSPTAVAEQLEKADSGRVEKEELLRSLEAERAKVGQEIDRVYRLYVDAKLDGDGFARFYKPLDERRKQLDTEVPRLQAELDVQRIDLLSADRVLNEAHDLYNRWPSMTHDEKRRIVENITEAIVIGDGEINITLRGPPASSEPGVKWQSMLRHGRDAHATDNVRRHAAPPYVP
jgi:site-specific DNA recombinase